jgi:fructokinase
MMMKIYNKVEKLRLLLLMVFVLTAMSMRAAQRRTVYCMGETVMDILFRGSTPLAANAGGSALNSSVSLARAGVDVSFIGEVGNDSTGTHILDFLRANQVGTSLVRRCEGMRTTVSLAYLNEHNDARYVFFMDMPKSDDGFVLPDFHQDDILLLGSFYAVNPRNRQRFDEVLQLARQRGVIVYYDINLRSPHASMLPQLMPAIHQIISEASVVRGSRGDLRTVFGTTNADSVYQAVIAKGCSRFVCTRGADAVTIYTDMGKTDYPVKKIQTVSTIGAGDNFNAGFIYSLIKQGITLDQLTRGLSRAQWQQLEDDAQRFSQDCCMHLGNYISEELARELR